MIQPAPQTPFHKKITTLNRAAIAEAHYHNYANLIEVVVHLLLPAGSTRALRALVDTGASDNFLSSNVQQEFGIPLLELAQLTPILMGTEGTETPALGETPPITLKCGSCCTHRTNFTILPLGDYDLVLGRPFQKYTSLIIQDDVCSIPTKRGPQALPTWVSQPDSDHTLIRISRREMAHTLGQMDQPETAILLIPKPALYLLKSPELCQHQDMGQHKDPTITARLNKQHA